MVKNDDQIVVRLPATLRAEIAARAVLEDRSEAQIVRMALAAYLPDKAA